MNEEYLNLFVKNAAGVGIYDPLFLEMSGFRKSTIYPAGLYADAQFILPRDILTRPSMLDAGFEVTIVSGALVVYHGWVDELEDASRSGSDGTRVSCVGDWAKFMERRGLNRYWADQRLNSREWKWQDSGGGQNLASVKFNAPTPSTAFNQAQVIPSSDAWANNDVHSVIYEMPTGETIGRITCSYELQEAAQQWTLRMYNRDAAAAYWAVTASGTGTQDVTVSTGSLGNSAQIQLVANAAQTPAPDTIYGRVFDLTLYATRDHASATLGNVNAYEVALDIVDRLGVDETSISADVSEISSSLTLSLVPFISNGFEMYASQISRAAGYGDSSQNAIGYGLRPPNYAPDDKPRLFLETYPALTDYDYFTTSGEAGLSVRMNLDDVWNWIIVEYSDDDNNRVSVTPDDDANLKDTTSISAYGQREKVLRVNTSDSGTAVSYGRRYLARHKQPTYAVTRPLRVSRLRMKNGGWAPAMHIDAGKRLRISDLPDRIAQNGGSGTTFLITRADYDHTTGIATLSIGGVPDDLAIMLAQMELITP